MEETKKIIVYRNRNEEYFDSDEGRVMFAYIMVGLLLIVAVCYGGSWLWDKIQSYRHRKSNWPSNWK